MEALFLFRLNNAYTNSIHSVILIIFADTQEKVSCNKNSVKCGFEWTGFISQQRSLDVSLHSHNQNGYGQHSASPLLKLRADHLLRLRLYYWVMWQMEAHDPFK
jgi:hypothetical protein